MSPASAVFTAFVPDFGVQTAESVSVNHAPLLFSLRRVYWQVVFQILHFPAFSAVMSVKQWCCLRRDFVTARGLVYGGMVIQTVRE